MGACSKAQRQIYYWNKIDPQKQTEQAWKSHEKQGKASVQGVCPS